MRRALFLLAGLVGAGCARDPARPEATPTTPLELGRTYTAWFHERKLDRLWERMSPEMRQALGGVQGLRGFRAQVEKELGSETGVADERVIDWLGSDVYNRTASFAKAPRPFWVQWTMSRQGTVLAFLVKPAEEPAPTRFLEHQTRTELRLPFTGEWFVFWGGRTAVENYHAVAADQRFAYDFVIARNGRTHAGSGSRLADFFCYGEPILAPGGGTVVGAADGIADNVPGVMNAEQPLGNHVVLDHGGGEFSFLAHLQRGSVAVREGQEVRAGQALGRCGNSGNSSEPHLHYHLQTTREFGRGEGLPAQFVRYLANGETVARGEPSRGQTIRAP